MSTVEAKYGGTVSTEASAGESATRKLVLQVDEHVDEAASAQPAPSTKPDSSTTADVLQSFQSAQSLLDSSAVIPSGTTEDFLASSATDFPLAPESHASLASSVHDEATAPMPEQASLCLAALASTEEDLVNWYMQHYSAFLQEVSVAAFPDHSTFVRNL